jgi:hypothetical protein
VYAAGISENPAHEPEPRLGNRSEGPGEQQCFALLFPCNSSSSRLAIVADGMDAEAIGVISDVRESSAEENAGAEMQLPSTKQFGPEGANLVMRAKLPTSALAMPVMRTLRQINSGATGDLT